jgi:hypothetical protein
MHLSGGDYLDDLEALREKGLRYQALRGGRLKV